MASWQHAFNLFSSGMTDARREDAARFEAFVAAVLPPTKSWSRSIRQFGDLERSVCEMSDHDEGTDVLIRFDVGGPWKPLLAHMWRASQACNLIWREAPDGGPLHSYNEIESLIVHGRAALFVRDPHLYLETTPEFLDEGDARAKQDDKGRREP